MSGLKNWKEIPTGGVIEEAGNADNYVTGGWRTYKPVLDEQKCIHCLVCWISCPDTAIEVKDEKMTGFNLKHCKGCGVCADVCPKKVQAITMVQEGK
ncbi:MAG: 4Fe-4S dicluster-binding protein [bacterium]